MKYFEEPPYKVGIITKAGIATSIGPRGVKKVVLALSLACPAESGLGRVMPCPSLQGIGPARPTGTTFVM